jgi:hypothetical protein
MTPDSYPSHAPSCSRTLPQLRDKFLASGSELRLPICSIPPPQLGSRGGGGRSWGRGGYWPGKGGPGDLRGGLFTALVLVRHEQVGFDVGLLPQQLEHLQQLWLDAEKRTKGG